MTVIVILVMIAILAWVLERSLAITELKEDKATGGSRWTPETSINKDKRHYR